LSLISELGSVADDWGAMSIRLIRPVLVGAFAAVALMAAGCATSSTPVPAPPPPQLVEAGGAHSCAIDANQLVYCWGQNAHGQLGIGSFVDSPTPYFVPGMSNATEVTASFQHSCAIKAGAVYCWGSNSDGQLGDGTTIDRPSPVQVAGLSNITQIATGVAHSCALGATGAVWCWGDNSQSQLGNGSTADSPTPVQVTGIDPVATIAARGFHTCALTTAGAPRCWGDNSNGQLGNGSTVDASTPVAPTGISTASTIAVGTFHTCATVGTTTSCWGNNAWGQLGDGTTTGSTLPVTVAGLSGATSLALGAFHSCAVVAGGAVRCWGYNAKGQLGDGTVVSSSHPVSVVSLVSVTHLSAGLTHTCAVITGNLVVCWGDNGAGQLGNTAAGSQANTPVLVEQPTAPPPVVPPGNVNTVTDYSLNCQATLGGNPVQTNTIAAETTVSHPPSIHAGQTFHAVVSSADVVVPLTYPPGVTLDSMANFAIRVSIPPHSALVSATATPGVNVGVGTPSVTNHGTYVELDVPGLLTAGTTATLPSIDLELQATGTSGQTIDFGVPGTSYTDWGYSFEVNVVGLGTVVQSCYVNPSPNLGTVSIT
jgi:alpha-tubulin suppressor-like RCC1 family protein